GGLTYADFGHVAAGPEPHDVGEIWAETMWDLRTRLGSALVAKLYVDGLRLVRDEPSFLDLRDAILTADRAVAAQERRADDTAAIWEVFARRGMGYRAATVDGFDESPRADFSLPPAPAAPAAPVATPRSTPAPAAP